MAKSKVNKKMGPVAVELPECPVCMDVMSAPIFQCQSGHSICNSCTRILLPPICPICRQAMTQMRNWQLEELISKATVPCPNRSSGCVYTMVSTDMEDHLKECIFREMACPLGIVFGRCSWTGKLKDILDHFKERHPNHCYMNTDNDININNISISVDERYMYLMPQGKFLFLLTFKVDTCQKMAYWVVQHIGSKKAAQQHVYGIHITSKQDDKRTVIFTDKCFNDAFDVNEIFRQARCGVMPLTMLSHFIKDGKLSFQFIVKKNQPFFKNKDKGFVKETNQRPKGPGPQNAGNQSRGKSPGPMHLQQHQKGSKGFPQGGKNKKQ
ncbi:E3 ubiquitin-protein ligase SIAH1-like [Vanessa atalanta]|uniref:E3 ubiquitin-protein ligase SIAH1-like n=1 Tax=Vanessa atalanta TaxID=42275 RepID=UPI001FCDDD03|nr:E3 ubiquitin-protein ligase SIAH1-like [Vanessa atalanta]XP_047529845.1 E3 ubiquitin-protein ligase SIAH1-like [Vanessa atalanta]XP_047529846.1 E3 ubiquitin-protein ligase SIAH1-like [Vanessa atalanta]XP_047529847.1 E3 ubiquitin-protein ligase SIAH1-like [Vanessa atalanta]